MGFLKCKSDEVGPQATVLSWLPISRTESCQASLLVGSLALHPLQFPKVGRNVLCCLNAFASFVCLVMFCYPASHSSPTSSRKPSFHIQAGVSAPPLSWVHVSTGVFVPSPPLLVDSYIFSARM